MVPTEPQLSNVTELIVVGNHLRRQMAMIVNNRLRLRTPVIQLSGSIRVKHKVVINKLAHILINCHTSNPPQQGKIACHPHCVPLPETKIRIRVRYTFRTPYYTDYHTLVLSQAQTSQTLAGKE